MSQILPYFTDANYINLIDSLNIALETFFGELISLNLNQFVYASNAYAFRRRSDLNKGNITLPFVNLKLKTITEDNTFKNWQYNIEHTGIYIEELGIKVAIRPVMFNYESSFWCTQEEEVHYTMTKLVFHGDDPSTVTWYPQYGCQTFPILGHLAWSGGPTMDTAYTENDWLTKNNIHNISMDFGIRSFVALANTDISIPDTILFKFGVAQFGPDVTQLSQQELYTMVIDHFGQTIGAPVESPIVPPIFP